MSLRSCICSLVDVHTGVPEARLVVGRTYESLELCGRLATYAQKDELATPLFDALDKRLAEPDARGAREAQRCRAAALRLAAGLAANPEAPAALVQHAVEVLSQSEAAVDDEDASSSDSDDDGDEPMLAVVRDEADLPARRRPFAASCGLPSCLCCSSPRRGLAHGEPAVGATAPTALAAARYQRDHSNAGRRRRRVAEGGQVHGRRLHGLSCALSLPRASFPRGGWCVWGAFLEFSLRAILLHAPLRRRKG